MALRKHIPRTLWMLLGVALVARVLLIFADASTSVLAQPDISQFHHERALALAHGWHEGQFLTPLSELAPNRDTGLMRTLVAYLIAPFYAVLSPITGTSPVPGRIGISIYSLGLGLLGYALARELSLDGRPAVVVGGLALFWPGIVYRSVVIQREVFVALATLTVVWIGMRWARSASASGWSSAIRAAVLAAACAMLFVIRPENLLIVAAVLAVSAIVRYREQVRTVATVAVLAAGGAVYAVANLGTFIGGRAALRGVGLTPRVLDRYAHARAHGDTAYLTWLHYDTWLDVAAFAPLKVVYFLGSPMLWSASSVSGLLAGASGAALLVMSVLAVYGAVCLFRADSPIGSATSRAATVLLAFLIVGVGAYAVIEMNGGAAFRRRITFVPAIVAFAVIALSTLRQRIDIERSTNTDESIPHDSASPITTDSE
jgi:hypothetical protein